MKISEILALTQEIPINEIAKKHLSIGEKATREALKTAGCYSLPGKKGWFFDSDQKILDQSIYDFLPVKATANKRTANEKTNERKNIGNNETTNELKNVDNNETTNEQNNVSNNETTNEQTNVAANDKLTANDGKPTANETTKDKNVNNNETTNEQNNITTNQTNNEHKNVGNNETSNIETNETTNVRKRFSVDVSIELIKQMKIKAVVEDRNLYELVEEALIDYLNK